MAKKGLAVACAALALFFNINQPIRWLTFNTGQTILDNPTTIRHRRECCRHLRGRVLMPAEIVFSQTIADYRKECARALGSVKSTKKAMSSRENGKNGGRPKKEKKDAT